jgi:hypothetical protein
MQHVTDLKSHEREAFLTARQLCDSAGVPLISALEDYLHARQLAGAESLAAMATEYSKHFGNITRRATVPEVVTQILEASPLVDCARPTGDRMCSLEFDSQ